MRTGKHKVLKAVGLTLIHAGVCVSSGGALGSESGSGIDLDGVLEDEAVAKLMHILHSHSTQQAEVCDAAYISCEGFAPQADLRTSYAPFAAGCIAGMLLAAALRICTRCLTKRATADSSRRVRRESESDTAEGFSMSSLRSISGSRTASFRKGVRTTPLANADSATFDMDTYPVVIE